MIIRCRSIFLRSSRSTTRYDANLVPILFLIRSTRFTKSVGENATWLYISGAVRFISRGGNTNTGRVRVANTLELVRPLTAKLTNLDFFIAPFRRTIKLLNYGGRFSRNRDRFNAEVGEKTARLNSLPWIFHSRLSLRNA